MFMSGITDEREFDGYAEKIRVPYLIAGGESDELCPLENTKAFAKALGGPKQLIIYADARHSIGGVPSATNGPDPRAYQAKWVQAWLAGKPLTSEYWFCAARVKKSRGRHRL